MSLARIVGRFAPSPTGPLHFGSLVAALGSYLEARAYGGKWLVRIEDLDQPRTVPGAASEILRTLDALGLGWDGSVLYQSTRSEAYASALEELSNAGLAYRCACTRSEIAQIARRGESGFIYPGTCREKQPGPNCLCFRVRTTNARVGFIDGSQGLLQQQLECEIGDFVVRRSDGVHAYQLAVVVDDAEQGVNQIVRGSDLLTSTPRQIHLQTLLGYTTPMYRHLPLAVTADGGKLSKMTSAPPVNLSEPGSELTNALAFLGQNPPPYLAGATAPTVLDWGLANWRPDLVPRTRALSVPTELMTN